MPSNTYPRCRAAKLLLTIGPSQEMVSSTALYGLLGMELYAKFIEWNAWRATEGTYPDFSPSITESFLRANMKAIDGP